jgi:hypothetical protein
MARGLGKINLNHSSSIVIYYMQSTIEAGEVWVDTTHKTSTGRNTQGTPNQNIIVLTHNQFYVQK